MAKNNNIRLPDGTTVSIPAWASENTLKALLGQLKVGSRFYKSLTDLIARGDYDASKLSQAIQKNSKAHIRYYMGTRTHLKKQLHAL